MLTSTKVALGSTLLWAAFNVFKKVYAPDFDLHDDDNLAVLISGPMFAALSISQFLANLLVFIAFVAFAVAGLTKLKIIRSDPDE